MSEAEPCRKYITPHLRQAGWRKTGSMGLVFQIVMALLFGNTWTAQAATFAYSWNITGPAGSGSFGSSISVLPNGNIVIVDSAYDDGAIVDAGAVYLYDGKTHAQISLLKGTASHDQLGSGGVTVLSNGNFVISSPFWDNGAITDAGTVTWASGTTGISGVVSAANSLVGGTAGDSVGIGGVTALTNGSYVVRSPLWDHGTITDAGAVTWGSGTTGVIGAVSASNSLVGSGASDFTYVDVIALSNGNYVVNNPYWASGSAANTGAITWGSGTAGVSGIVSAANSLVGSSNNDQVGSRGVIPLSSGNYVVISPYWDNASAGGSAGAVLQAGAVTWGSGSAGISGVVSPTNSLVGSTAYDFIGTDGVRVLSNGNYVVPSQYWDNGSAAGAAIQAGAVTWGSGTAGVTGAVSAANSLVGSTTGDYISSGGVTALSNGNYVVNSASWHNGDLVVGAVTWGSGAAGVTGAVSAANSLVGSRADDFQGGTVVALNNGSYVVRSPSWDNGTITDAGAATWASATAGISGVISAANSLVGSTASDNISGDGVKVLSSGNYVVLSKTWDNGTITDAGAATWASATAGVSGVVSAANSLVGSTAGDAIGSGGVTALSNGNYVVLSSGWDNGTITDAGAVTWGSGVTGARGVVSPANSLVGSTTNDFFLDRVTALSNGNYVVSSPFWDNGTAADAGAATWGSGTAGVSGVVSPANSLVGAMIDFISLGGVTALTDGDYVVNSRYWNNSAPLAAHAGAVTWGNGATGTTGMVSSANSLVGSTEIDYVGYGNVCGGVTALSGGRYVVCSPYWDNGATPDAGAISLGKPGGVTGTVSANNSVLGTVSDQGGSLNWKYDEVNQQLVVGRPAENMVTIFWYVNNDAPALVTSLPDQTAITGRQTSIDLDPALYFADAGDTLTYSAAAVDTNGSPAPWPAWLTFDNQAVSFSAAPAASDAGGYPIRLTATDSMGQSVSDIFNLQVVLNAAPVAATIQDQSAPEDLPFSFQIPTGAFSDANGDPLEYSASAVDSGGSPAAWPAWLTFIPATRTFSGTPTHADLRPLTIQVTARDGSGATAALTFQIQVMGRYFLPIIARYP